MGNLQFVDPDDFDPEKSLDQIEAEQAQRNAAMNNNDDTGKF